MNRNMMLIAFALASCLAWATVGQADDEGWAGEANLSVAAGSGTTNSFAGNLDAKTARSWENDVAGVRFNATYGTSKPRKQRTETTQNQQALYGDWKHTLSERFFWKSGAELSRDDVQDRELRARVGTGPGFRVWQKTEAGKEHFDIYAGMGYRYEIYDGNAGEAIVENGDTDHFADATAGFEYKHLLFDGKVDFTHTANIALPVNAPNAFIVDTEVIASVPLNDAWSFRVGTLVQYVNEVPDEIVKLTTTTTVGLGYKF